jgi:hypothetical protein
VVTAALVVVADPDDVPDDVPDLVDPLACVVLACVVLACVVLACVVLACVAVVCVVAVCPPLAAAKASAGADAVSRAAPAPATIFLRCMAAPVLIRHAASARLRRGVNCCW